MADEVRLLIQHGAEYKGWTSVSITRSIEQLCGSFALSVSEKWSGRSDPWPIWEEDACKVKIGDETVIAGWVDRAPKHYDNETHDLTVEGRDIAGALVDCSAVLKDRQFRNRGILEVCQAIAGPFGISIYLQDGLADAAISTKPASDKPRAGASPGQVGSEGRTAATKIGKPNEDLTIEPGESGFSFIDRACRKVGVLPISDGQGGICLSRAGGAQCATALIEGRNILSAESLFDASRRYYHYIVDGQNQADDEEFGLPVTQVRGEAFDQGVRRTERVLLVQPEGPVTAVFAKQRAQWEAKVRAARASEISVEVQGWRQGNGQLWPINALVQVDSPKLAVSGLMLITGTTFTLNDKQGSRTLLRITRPDAFVPEPTVSKAGQVGIAELMGGMRAGE